MSELEAGPELDALVAEKVFGWEWWLSENSGRRCLFAFGKQPEWFKCRAEGTEGLVGDWASNPSNIPRYSTDIAAAWTVVEKLQDKGMDFSLASRNESRRWWSAVFDIAMTEGRWHSDGYAVPLAICRAAMKAVQS